MQNILRLSEQDREDLFRETAARRNITPAAAEKDFWICLVLGCLFRHQELRHILRFKGGTALAKCFHIIERFSEDIDLVLDWTQLSQQDPEKERSRTQQAAFNKELNERARHWIRASLLPELTDMLAPDCTVSVDPSEGLHVHVAYTTLFDASYLRPAILLEAGPLASMSPSSQYEIQPFAAEYFPEIFDQTNVHVEAIVPERTFWEKVTILHAQAHRKADSHMPPRYARHYYDVFRMLQTPVRERAILD